MEVTHATINDLAHIANIMTALVLFVAAWGLGKVWGEANAMMAEREKED